MPTLSAGSSVVVDATAENPHSTPGALGGPGDDGASHNLPEASSIKVSGYDSPSQSVESRRHLWRVSASSPASPAVASAGALVHALACLPRLARLELTEVTFEGPDSPILQLLYSLSRLQSLKHLILSKVGLSHKGAHSSPHATVASSSLLGRFSGDCEPYSAYMLLCMRTNCTARR